MKLELVEALLSEVELSEVELRTLLNDLVSDFAKVMCCKVDIDPNPMIDLSGAFPSFSLECRSVEQSSPFQLRWFGLMSLNGYDEDVSWNLNCNVHVFPFLGSQRIMGNGLAVIRFDLRQSESGWFWHNEGWIADEFEEFDCIVSPFP